MVKLKGVPVTENENVTNTVIEISKLLGVEITKSVMSTAQRLATKHPKNGVTSSEPLTSSCYTKICVQGYS